MHHPALGRARSQHFASSPRKANTLKFSRQPPKKRRITALFGGPQPLDIDVGTDDDNTAGPSARARSVLSAEGGQQTVNQVQPQEELRRSKSKRKGKAPAHELVNGAIRDDGRPGRDVFNSGDESSPRKRKRDERDAMEMSTEGSSSSWVETTEDEGEPEFIAESDQYLLHEASCHALRRLRKAELIRLWKVAGMWDDEKEEQNEDEDRSMLSAADDDDDGGMAKKDLVDGLLNARKTSSHNVSASASTSSTSPRTSPKRKSPSDATIEPKRLRSTSSTYDQSEQASSSTSVTKALKRVDIQATPKPGPKNRRARITDVALMRSLPRRTPGPGTGKLKNRTKGRHDRGRSKSMGGEGEAERGRKARFGDEVKSPARGLLRTRARRSSTLSSAYATTDADASPDDSPITIRRTPARPRRPAMPRGYTPARRLQAQLGRGSFRPSPMPRGKEIIEIIDSSDDDEDNEEDLEPTPLVARLRSRGRNSLPKPESNDHEADEEDDDTEDEEESYTSPMPQRQLRSKDKGIEDSGISMIGARKVSRPRGAKSKAMEALKGGESDAVEVMDLDEDDAEVDESVEQDLAGDDSVVVVDEGDGGPQSEPLRRSQRRVTSGKLRPKDSLATDPMSQVSKSPSNFSEDGDMSIDQVDDEDDSEVELDADTSMSTADGTETEGGAVTRTTRSGKAFGVWQSRRRRLRQEALDDPDMEVDDEDEEIEDEDEEEEEEDSFEPDIDLGQATQSSLVRYLRDELVQMCEARGLEVGGTKPQLARSLLIWWKEQQGLESARSTTSSQATARPQTSKPQKIIHAVASNVHVSGKTTPVLLRDHIHVTDPVTPPPSDESKRNGDAELNLDLQELGLEDSIIKPEQLQKLDRIGSGGFKDVYVGKYRGRKVAISEFRGHLSEMDIRELKLLAEFSHTNIVKFRGICIPEDSQVHCMLVSELCENGDLFDYIRNVPCPSVKRVLGLMLDIARGLEYLHTRKPAIIHRDCKSSNILINRAGQAKVGDFGLARVKTSTRSMIRSLVGTVNWQAPELWHPHPRYDYKVDVFSAGVVYWEMMSGWIGEKKYPWEGHNEHYIYDAVGNKQRRPSVAGLRKHWGNEMVNLMERMWHQDPAERPTMTDVVADLEALYFAGPFTPLRNGL